MRGSTDSRDEPADSAVSDLETRQSTVARDALLMVQTNPSAAHALATKLLEVVDQLSDEERVVARWALGRALYELGDVPGSIIELRRSLASAVSIGRLDLVVQVRASLAVTLVEHGSTAKALVELDLAERDATGEWLGRIVSQRAFVFHHLGRFAESIAESTRALPILRKAHDELGECRLRLNRAIAHLAAGDTSAARQDLQSCRVLALTVGQHLIVGAVDHALGAVELREGSIPAALSLYADARRQYQALGTPARMTAILEDDFSEAYSLCGLTDDALAAAHESLRLTKDAGNVVHEAEGHLRLAVALGQADKIEESAIEARAAARLFRRSSRPAWAAVAELRAVQAQLRIEETPIRAASKVRSVERLLAILQTHGWRTEVIEAHLVAAELAVVAGQLAIADGHINIVKSARACSVLATASRHYVEALKHLRTGRFADVNRLLSHGVRRTAEFQRAFGATELRVHSTIVSDRLTGLGVRVAVDRNKPRDAFRWSEERRAASLRSWSTDTAVNNAVSSRLRDLRNLATQRRNLVGNSAVDGNTIDADIARLERDIVELGRTACAPRAASDEAVPISNLRKALGNRLLISFFESRDSIYAVLVGKRTTRLCAIGPRQTVGTELTYLSSALHRLFSSTEDRSAISAEQSIRVAANQLDRLLMLPLALPGGTELIIVPSPTLHGVAWGLLPSLESVDHTVAPSATAWWTAQANDLRPANRTVGVAVGPDVSFGTMDVNAVTAAFPSARCLEGKTASSRNVQELFETCDHVHIAAHGVFRSDNPLFSSLRFSDGSLTMVEFQHLTSAPRTVVLAACDAASVRAHGHGEVLGTAMTLLGRGVRSIIAPAIAVPDAQSATVIKILYRELAGGGTTSNALTAARKATSTSDPLTRVTAGLYCAHGASTTVAQLPRVTL